MKVILAAFGSYGDIKPFLWMGKALRKSGHDIVFIANPFFEEVMKGEAIEFRPAGTREEYLAAAAPAAITGNRFRDQGERIAASRRLFDNMFLRPARATYDIISEYRGESPAVIGHFYAYGAKLASEKFNLPYGNVCLSPYWLRNFIKPSGFPSAFTKLGANATTRFIDGQLFTKPFNELRAKAGLASMKESSARWMFGGSNLCLFPEWFADINLERDIQAVFAGFPLEQSSDGLPVKTAEFLEKHEKPVVFTPGSAVTDAEPFFREALKALRTLGKPGIFLTRADIPEKLPENVLHCAFIPLDQLLDRCGAIVHHGGIGTAAQALAAGTPQLICHRMDEQRENARNLLRLGVCKALPYGRMEGGEMAILIEKLITDSTVREKCAGIAGKPMAATEERLEGYLQSIIR